MQIFWFRMADLPVGPFTPMFIGLLARPERFELPTPRFVVWCSIQLSYGRLTSPGIIAPSAGAACGARHSYSLKPPLASVALAGDFGDNARASHMI